MDRRGFLSNLAGIAVAGAGAGNLSSHALGESGSKENRAAWMKTSKWGVMTHYLADWIEHETNQPMSVERWNDLIDHFDADALADQLHSAGAGYYQISIGQNSGYYLAPNPTYDRLVGIHPSKCSRRDLVSDLYGALEKRGIRLMVYLPSGAPDRDAAAVEALSWKRGPDRNQEFQIKWQHVIEAWSRRWGNKISGWWFDGCYWPNAMYRSCQAPNFASFAVAARAGNSESAVAFNPGVYHRIFSPTQYGDYTAGEMDLPDRIQIARAADGLVDGAQIYILSHLGEKWGSGAPRFSTDDVVAWTRKVVSQHGAFTWDTPVQIDGHISGAYMDQLTAIGKALKQD